MRNAVDVDRPPRIATAPDLSRRSLGGQVAVIAEALGTPLMPWQRYVADVACEVADPATGRWAYPLVVVTVPRQAGKTTLVRAVTVHRAVTRPRSRIFTTAQRGKDARDRWADLVERVEHGPLGGSARVLRGTGSESLHFPNGSEIRPFAPVESALHGETPPLVVIDEAWAFDAAQGEALMAAIRPAQITLPHRQLWILSTAGTAASAFLRSWVETGRDAVRDPGSSVAYFEWSADEGADAYDPSTWAFHPAIGHTIDAGDIAAEAESETSRGNFERAYLNRWTATANTAVDLDKLDALAGALPPPPSTGLGLVLAYDVAADRSGASVWAAWRAPDGRAALRLYASAPGTSWLAPALRRAVDELPGVTLAADDGGPARLVTDQLDRTLPDEAPRPTVLGFRDFATATGALLDVLDRGPAELVTDGSPALRTAAEVAALRPVSDQRAWDRRRSSGPIDALVASTVALWVLDHLPAPAAEPLIFHRNS